MAIFNGNLSLDNGSVVNSSVQANAGIGASKLQHENTICEAFKLDVGDTPVASDRVVFVVPSAGTITSFSAGLVDTGTTTDVDFDLEVNGSSVLSAVVNVTNSVADRVSTAGTITSAVVSAGDVVSMSLAVTTSTGALGPFASVTIVTTATGSDAA